VERQNIYEQYPSKRDMVDAIYNLRASKKALESELKAAEDHAATMETCVKDMETERDHYKDAFEVVEAEMLKRVPFEVVCRTCVKPHDGTCKISLDFRTPDKCPLTPKVKTDDIPVEESATDKEELEYMRKLAYSIEHDTMPPER
jgi:hypothetical protein